MAARKAVIARHHPDLDTSDLDRELKVARAEDYIRRIVSSAPPLRPEDVERLRTLLPAAPAAGDSGGAAA